MDAIVMYAKRGVAVLLVVAVAWALLYLGFPGG